jgi:hypothetical protein
MKLDCPKNRKLIKQFPFVKKILDDWIGPYAGWNENAKDARRVDRLIVRVQKADGDLLFRVADNVGLSNNGFIFSTKSDREGQVMRRGEYIYATNKGGKIINRLSWIGENNPERESPMYAKEIFWQFSPKRSNPNFILKGVGCLVWVTVEAWHKHNKNDPQNPFGEFCDRSITITIYLEPNCGYHDLLENSNVYQNLRLNTKVLTQGDFDKDIAIITIHGQLAELCVLFQDDVYFNGMKEAYDKIRTKGASIEGSPVKILLYEACGYQRIMLEDAEAYITLQIRPGANHLYVLGCDGTLPQIRHIVKTAVNFWKNHPDCQNAIKSNKDVSLG